MSPDNRAVRPRHLRSSPGLLRQKGRRQALVEPSWPCGCERADDPGDGPKYLYVSSAKHGGAGPGAPLHIPIFTGPTEMVRFTEGELKADVATALSGMLTIAAPGVSCWRPAVPALKEFGVRTVRLAFDADARSNRHVARALKSTTEALAAEGSPSRSRFGKRPTGRVSTIYWQPERRRRC